MRYKNYGNYNEGPMGNYGRRMRDSRGRFMEGGYSARGYDSKYRGKEVLGDMMDAYEEGGYEAGGSNYKAGVAELLIEEGKAMLNTLKG